MGKPVLGDILNGQPNVVLAHALRQKNSHLKREVTRWVGKGTGRRPGNVTPIIEAVKALGSIDYACDVMNRYIGRARKALDRIPEGQPRSVLEGLLQLISALPEHNERLR
jgi:geranylgeranyl pyrophosphate synthase